MASALIGALRVNLAMDSAKFTRGMSEAQKRLRVARAQFLKVAGAAVAVGTALSAMAMKGAKDIDRLANTAKSLDATVASVQALKLAASDAGLDGMEGSLVRLNRRLGAAEFGAGAAAVTVKKLNLDLKALSKMDADERVASIADALRDSGMSMQQVARHAQNLGFEQAAAAEFFAQGGDAIRAARDRLVEYGLAVSQVDARRIQEASTRISDLGMIGQHVAQRLAVTIVPALGEVAKAMTDSLRPGGVLRAVLDALAVSFGVLSRAVVSITTALGIRYVAALVAAKVGTMSLAGALMFLRGALIRTGIGALIVAAGELVYQFLRLVKGAGGFGAALGLLKDLGIEVWQRLGDGANALSRTISAAAAGLKAVFGDAFAWILEKLVALTQKVATGLNNLFSKAGIDLGLVGMSGEGAKELRDWAEDERLVVGRQMAAAGVFLKAATAPLKSFQALKDVVKAADEELGNAGDTVRDFGDYLSDAGNGGAAGSANKLTEAIKELVAESQKLNATWAMTDLQASIWERLRDLGVEAASAQGQIISGLMTQIDHLRQLKEVTEEWRDTVVSAFTRFITQGGSFKQVLSQLIMKLAEMAAQSAMMNFWNASGASGFLGKALGWLGKVHGSADGNAFNAGRVMAFADGGVIGGPTLFPMRGGRIGLMGEAGPEAVMPLKRGPDGRLGVETHGPRELRVTVEMLGSGNLQAFVRNEAGEMVARSAPGIADMAVGKVQHLSKKSKGFLG